MAVNVARLPHGSVIKDALWNAYGMLKERSRQVQHVNGRQELNQLGNVGDERNESKTKVSVLGLWAL